MIHASPSNANALFILLKLCFNQLHQSTKIESLSALFQSQSTPELMCAITLLKELALSNEMQSAFIKETFLEILFDPDHSLYSCYNDQDCIGTL